MTSRNLLIAQGAVLSVLFPIVLFGIAHEYSDFVWFSAPAHFLGGLWVAFFAAWCLHLLRIPHVLLWAIGAALVFGMCWEIFELLIGATHFPANTIDTWQDIGMDMVGGGVGGFIVQRIWLRK